MGQQVVISVKKEKEKNNILTHAFFYCYIIKNRMSFLQKIFFSVVTLLIIVLLSIFYIHQDFFCGCNGNRESFKDAAITCKSTEYYCPLDRQCHSYCENVVDSHGNTFPCDFDTQMPYNPNGTLVYTDNANGQKTYVNKLLIPTKDIDVNQLNFDVSRLNTATTATSSLEKTRVKIFPKANCKLINPSIIATYVPYTKSMPIVFLTADTTFPTVPDKDLQSGKLLQIDSAHEPHTALFQSKTVKIPNAIKLKITWGKKTTFDKEDTFTIYQSSTVNNNNKIYEWKSDGNTISPSPSEEITIIGNVFTWSLSSKKKNNAWGFQMLVTPYLKISKDSDNQTIPLMVTSTIGLENGFKIKVGDEITTVADIKSNILFVPKLQYSHFKGESIVSV